MFPRSSYPIKLTGMLYDQTGSRNSKMAASKPEVPISQHVDMIGKRFQRLYICFVFKVQLSNRAIKKIALPNQKWEFQNGGIKTGSSDISP